MAPIDEPATAIRIPPFESFCDDGDTPPRAHADYERAVGEHQAWLFAGIGKMSERKKDKYIALDSTLLSCLSYRDASFERLRVCCDFIGWLFAFDDLSDDMNEVDVLNISQIIMRAVQDPSKPVTDSRIERMARDFSARLDHTSARGTLRRFRATLETYLRAVEQEAQERRLGHVPTLEEYLPLRRDNGACRPSFVLVEYAQGVDIPDEVMEHPAIVGLFDACNDFVSWCNDIVSFPAEYGKGHTHNLVVVLMHERRLDIQSAVDLAGEMCKEAAERLYGGSKRLPSWGPRIDRDVQAYVDGLKAWAAGNVEWSYRTSRYFGDHGLEVKSSRVMRVD